MIQGCVDGWMDRRTLRGKWLVNAVIWATLCRRILTFIAISRRLKLEVHILVMNPTKRLLLIEVIFSGELKMWRDAGRIFMTPLPVETITGPFTGKKWTNISDESCWCTNTVYNVGNFGFLEQYLGRLSTAARRVSVTDWWFKLYDQGPKSSKRIQC
jgi:hypothetical protein